MSECSVDDVPGFRSRLLFRVCYGGTLTLSHWVQHQGATCRKLTFQGSLRLIWRWAEHGAAMCVVGFERKLKVRLDGENTRLAAIQQTKHTSTLLLGKEMFREEMRCLWGTACKKTLKKKVFQGSSSFQINVQRWMITDKGRGNTVIKRPTLIRRHQMNKH